MYRHLIILSVHKEGSVESTETIRRNKVKKTFRINPRLVKEVRRLLGARTETEAIEKALEQVRFKTDIRKWIDRSSARFPAL